MLELESGICSWIQAKQSHRSLFLRRKKQIPAQRSVAARSDLLLAMPGSPFFFTPHLAYFALFWSQRHFIRVVSVVTRSKISFRPLNGVKLLEISSCARMRECLRIRIVKLRLRWMLTYQLRKLSKNIEMHKLRVRWVVCRRHGQSICTYMKFKTQTGSVAWISTYVMVRAGMELWKPLQSTGPSFLVLLPSIHSCGTMDSLLAKNR